MIDECIEQLWEDAERRVRQKGKERKAAKEGWKDKKPKKVENEEKQLIIRGWQTDRKGGGRQGNGTMAR